MSKILIIYIRHIAFLILIVLLFNVACKKYEEGPCISLRSKDNRLCNYWDVDFIYINGIDSTKFLDIVIRHIDFHALSNNVYFEFYDRINDQKVYMNGIWEWYDNEKKIILHLDHQYLYNNKEDTLYNNISFQSIKPYNTVIFNVLKLKHSDVILELQDVNICKLILSNYDYR
ncbi:MAG: hypothetical protein Kow0068_01590 [Marinilabiliales bacterium]